MKLNGEDWIIFWFMSLIVFNCFVLGFLVC